MHSPIPLITIDGPIASGKSTTAQMVARELKLAHLYSGNFFRILGCEHLAGRTTTELLSLANNIRPVQLLGPLTDVRYRSEEVALAGAEIANHPRFRKPFISAMRDMPKQIPQGTYGLVADGRPLGTEIFNKGANRAGVKIYLTADADLRALRLAFRLGTKPTPALRKQMEARDREDLSRKFLRLAAAPDAVVLDTTRLNQFEVRGRIVSLALARYPQLRAVI